MNDARRAKMKKAGEILFHMQVLKIECLTIIKPVLDEELESLDKIPESLHISERGRNMKKAISNMERAIKALDSIDFHCLSVFAENVEGREGWFD
jgi:L-serine deaminase